LSHVILNFGQAASQKLLKLSTFCKQFSPPINRVIYHTVHWNLILYEFADSGTTCVCRNS